MPNTLGYMLTWTTYGNWLQGDENGYVKDGVTLGVNTPLENANKEQLCKDPVILTPNQRRIIDDAIRGKAIQGVNRRRFLLSAPEGSGTENVFSRKGGLPGNMDNDPTVHSIRELNLGSQGTLRIVYVTACYNANLNEESSEMGNEWLKDGIDSIGQVYISFIGTVNIEDGYHQEWDYAVWNKWFSPDQYDWSYVLNYCTIYCDQGSKIGSETGTCGDSSVRIR